ncbi:hypothetical protein FQZ97_714740 [compost metagenome]
MRPERASPPGSSRAVRVQRPRHFPGALESPSRGLLEAAGPRAPALRRSGFSYELPRSQTAAAGGKGVRAATPSPHTGSAVKPITTWGRDNNEEIAYRAGRAGSPGDHGRHGACADQRDAVWRDRREYRVCQPRRHRAGQCRHIGHADHAGRAPLPHAARGRPVGVALGPARRRGSGRRVESTVQPGVGLRLGYRHPDQCAAVQPYLDRRS